MNYTEMLGKARERLVRAHEDGIPLLGYFCPHTPIEIILAHGVTPCMLSTAPDVRGSYEDSLQTFACSYARNLFAQRSSGQMPPVPALLFPGNSCDSLQNVGDVWRHRFPEDKVLRLTYPAAAVDESSVRFLAEEIRMLSRSLKTIFGCDFSSEKLQHACSMVQDVRDSVQTMYCSRLLDPSVISYGDLAELFRLFLALPDSQSASAIKSASSDVMTKMGKKRFGKRVSSLRSALLSNGSGQFLEKRPAGDIRLAVVGGMTEPKVVSDIFEAVGALASEAVVFDSLSLGYKTAFTPSVDPAGNPYVEAARSILESPLEPTREGLSERKDSLRRLLVGLHIDGVVICEQSFCDPDEFESPSIERAVEDAGVPSVRLPVDSELSDRARVVGRVQTFIETLQGGA